MMFDEVLNLLFFVGYLIVCKGGLLMGYVVLVGMCVDVIGVVDCLLFGIDEVLMFVLCVFDMIVCGGDMLIFVLVDSDS